MEAEITILLKKILEKLDTIGTESFTDHRFFPEVDVGTTMTEIPVDGLVVSLVAKNSDIKVNFDRPITADEYLIIPQDTYITIRRKVQKIYAQSLYPGGKLRIIVLR